MKTGNLQRRWQETMPQVYDKETRIVCLDIVQETQSMTEGEETTEKQGYSYIPVEIDTQFDYGHIKSQLIEAGFAQKDEFGLLMNAVEDIITAVSDNSTIASIRAALNTEDIQTFKEFCQFRSICATAAHEVMEYYK